MELCCEEKIGIRERTKQAYKQRTRLLLQFAKTQDFEELLPNQITVGFFNRFYNWLLKQKYDGVNTYNVTYAGKVRQSIKTVLIWAVQNEKIENDPLSSLKIHVERNNNYDFLTMEEIELLEKYDFTKEVPKDKYRTGEKLQTIADCFLFACYTGCEYSGLKKMRFNEHLITMQGKICFVQDRTKTDVERFIPLDTKALKIIEKYKQTGELPCYSNKTFNEHLKRVQPYVGIKQRLYTHLGRHTFAHHALNTRFISLEAVAVAMGCDVSNVRKYAKLTRTIALNEF